MVCDGHLNVFSASQREALSREKRNLMCFDFTAISAN